MAHDDEDARESVRPEELLAPPGPRRSSYTPPARNAESLQAAANVFNDDAIAEAMAAELAKIASGPIPIVPLAYRMPAPGPVSAPAPADPPQAVGDAPQAPPVSQLVEQQPVEQKPAETRPSALTAPPPTGPPVLSVPSVPPVPMPLSPAVEPPPPYLGAPAPTVPPADAPPPPGYENAAPVPPPSSQPPGNDEPRLTVDDTAESVAEEPVSPFAPRPESEQSHDERAPISDEPSLEGTAFADFHFADFQFAPPTVPAAVPDETDSPVPFPGNRAPAAAPFPGFAEQPTDPAPAAEPASEPAAPPAEQSRHSMFAPPPLVEPPLPDPTYPVFSDQIGVVPSFGDQPASTAAEELPTDEPVVSVDPPTSPPVDFESLLAGADPPTGEWSVPPPNLFTEPTLDAATGAPLPFGGGVARDNAVDPTTGVFGTTLTPPPSELANSQGITIVGQLSTAVPVASFDEMPAPAAAAETILAVEATVAPRQRIFSAEISGEEPTPVDQRVGRAVRLFWLWFASNSSVVAVVFGGIVFSLGMSLRQAIVATLVGIALSFIPLGFGALAGKRSGQPTMVISRATFGVIGNVLPAVIGLLSRLFWGAALLWLVGAGAAEILAGAHLDDGFTQRQLTFVLMIVAFLIVIVCAYFGYALIARVQLVVSIVSAVLLIGFVALTAHYVNFSTALETGDGSWVLAITGAVLVFSFVGLVWANSSADVARYQRPASSGGVSMLSATFGAAVPSFLLIAYGALLCASDRKIEAGILTNPLDELGRLLPTWYPVPLIMATAFSLFSGAIVTIYSGGFALQATGFRIARKYSVLVVGVLVLVVALLLTLTISNFTQLFRDFATTVAVPVAAWAGIFAAEIMIRNRRFDSRSLLRRGGVYADARWGNLIALVVVTVIGLGLTSATVGWLSWEGYLFAAVGVPLNGQLASTDLGVIVALVLGLIFPIVAGIPAIRRQESATATSE